MLRRIAHIAICTCLAASMVSAQDATDRTTRIRRQVEAIALGDSIAGRRAAIAARLEAIGLERTIAWFDPASAQVTRRGANLVAEIPGSAGDVLLLGAHYDHLERAQGVIDNAAGVAAVLELAEAFARQPLDHYTVRVALFDLEEDGRLGSRTMVHDSMRTPLPEIMLNFDIFGYGSAFWVGASDPQAPLPQALREAGTTAGLHVVIDSLYPSSDHVSFRRTSTTAYAISLLDRRDIELLLTRFRSRGRGAGETPRIFRIMHTTEDTLDKLDAAAVARGVEAVERAIRRLDAAASAR